MSAGFVSCADNNPPPPPPPPFLRPPFRPGGSSTKLCIQSLNRPDVNSVHHVIPVACFEGFGEEYSILEHVFKPIFDQILSFTESFSPSSSSTLTLTLSSSSLTSSTATATSTSTSSSLSSSHCPSVCQLPVLIQESEIPSKLLSFRGQVQLNSSNTFMSASCSTCENLCDEHGLQPTPPHSPLSLQHAAIAQVVISADMPMLRMLIGCQTSANCKAFWSPKMILTKK